MIGLSLFAENGQAIGKIAGDYFKLSGVFRYDENTPLNINGRAFIDYPAIINKNGKRYKRERLYFVSYEPYPDTIANPITITPLDSGLLIYTSIQLRQAEICPANIYYGYINEIPL